MIVGVVAELRVPSHLAGVHTDELANLAQQPRPMFVALVPRDEISDVVGSDEVELEETAASEEHEHVVGRLKEEEGDDAAAALEEQTAFGDGGGLLEEGAGGEVQAGGEGGGEGEPHVDLQKRSDELAQTMLHAFLPRPRPRPRLTSWHAFPQQRYPAATFTQFAKIKSPAPTRK